MLGARDKTSYRRGPLARKAHTAPVNPTPAPGWPTKTKPANFDTPARDLSEQEAREIVCYLISTGEIKPRRMYGPPPNFPPLKLLVNGNYEGLLLDADIAGVIFVNLASTPDPSKQVISGPGWRIALVAYRLALLLKAKSGATQIFHKGFKGAGPADDQHNLGRALDFVGALTSVGDLRVQTHWSNQTVPNAIGGVNGDWPPTHIQTRFRLDAATNRTAHDFFKLVYNFGTEQCRDNSSKQGHIAPFAPLPTGAILHPDYGAEPSKRKAHFDHIHFDVQGSGHDQYTQ
jgi:hypothetical protein